MDIIGQIMIELPHVNIFTKIDLLKNIAKDLDFRLDYYAENHDLSQLLAVMHSKHPRQKKFAALNAAICELVEDYNLIAFRPLDVQDKHSVLDILQEIDNANGFSLGSVHADLSMFNISSRSTDSVGDKWGLLHERYIDKSDEEDSKGVDDDDIGPC
eukprot:GHVS01012428.1.p2 GENE.GHVS01012428.1~~GHVS01012428.1.p2  ORF type:complete len:157 (+),score=17.88 GHVS01012428.1:717-1187(+)